MLSRYMHDPGKGHWQTSKQVLPYILGTVGVGLMFEQNNRFGQHVVGYVDSHYPGDLDKHISTT